MDSADRTVSIDQIADLVVEKLMESGRLADLATADLESIEEETIFGVDQITRNVISKLLGKQAAVIELPTHCPKCGGQVSAKPTQGRCLQSRRGKVAFKTEVVRCEACRLDFFPSVQSPRL